MIQLITEELDITSDKIIEWILFLGYNVERNNVETYSDFTFEINDKSIEGLSDNTFHRRAKLNTFPDELNFFPYKNEIRLDDNLILKAWEKISKNEGKYIGEFTDEEQHNKILDLYFARKTGFNIPDTLVTNNKTKLIEFISRNGGKIITKSIKNPIQIEDDYFVAIGRETMLLELNELDTLNDNFNLCLFQKFIDKIFEVRVFVYGNKMFSMAIFSDYKGSEQIDFRIATSEMPKRYIPFSLPLTIQKKIKKFFKIKSINTGSIDLIVDTNNTFYFLENNCQGQFDWVSVYCNYNIEKYIALDLIQNEKSIQK